MSYLQIVVGEVGGLFEVVQKVDCALFGPEGLVFVANYCRMVFVNRLLLHVALYQRLNVLYTVV